MEALEYVSVKCRAGYLHEVQSKHECTSDKAEYNKLRVKLEIALKILLL